MLFSNTIFVPEEFGLVPGAVEQISPARIRLGAVGSQQGVQIIISAHGVTARRSSGRSTTGEAFRSYAVVVVTGFCVEGVGARGE